MSILLFVLLLILMLYFAIPIVSIFLVLPVAILQSIQKHKWKLILVVALVYLLPFWLAFWVVALLVSIERLYILSR